MDLDNLNVEQLKMLSKKIDKRIREVEDAVFSSGMVTVRKENDTYRQDKIWKVSLKRNIDGRERTTRQNLRYMSIIRYYHLDETVDAIDGLIADLESVRGQIVQYLKEQER